MHKIQRISGTDIKVDEATVMFLLQGEGAYDLRSTSLKAATFDHASFPIFYSRDLPQELIPRSYNFVRLGKQKAITALFADADDLSPDGRGAIFDFKKKLQIELTLSSDKFIYTHMVMDISEEEFAAWISEFNRVKTADSA